LLKLQTRFILEISIKKCYNFSLTKMKATILHIKNLVQKRKYRITLHAEQERDTDQITKEEIEGALLSDKLEIIEDYPNDPRGHSYLLLGFTNNDKPIHFVCGLGTVEMLIVITLYIPDENLWVDYKKRRL